jgi:hypothetical protein
MSRISLLLILAACTPQVIERTIERRVPVEANEPPVVPDDPTPSPDVEPDGEPDLEPEPDVEPPPPTSSGPVAGDGVCGAGETFATAPTDCPPPSVTFAGGTVAQLRAYSANLVFTDLVIAGTLQLPAGSGETVITARNVTVSGTGMVTVTWATCSYSASPSLSIIASEAVRFDGAVTLSGRRGDRHTLDATCRNCEGQNGGTLTVAARSIVANALIDVSGGDGSQLVDLDYTVGCGGGDAGDIVLDASSGIVSGAVIRNRRGAGGSGGWGMGSGTSGSAGAVVFDAPDVDVREVEANGTLSTAQVLPWSRLTLTGGIDPFDDESSVNHTDASTITVANGSVDRVRDEFRLCNHGAASASFLAVLDALPPTQDRGQADCDIDLYAINLSATAILAESNGATGHEQLGLTLAPGACHILGVTVCTGSCNYTLSIQ